MWRIKDFIGFIHSKIIETDFPEWFKFIPYFIILILLLILIL